MKGIVSYSSIAALLALSSMTANAALVSVDPDSFPAGTDISLAYPGVILSTRDGLAPGSNSREVTSATDPNASTGTRVFAHDGGNTTWGDGVFEFLRADFAGGTTYAALDFFANDEGGDHNAQLLAFNSAGVLVDTASADFIDYGDYMMLSVSAPDIAYIAAYWDEKTHQENGGLDNLVYDSVTAVPEPSVLALLTAAGAGFGLFGGLPGARTRRKASKS